MMRLNKKNDRSRSEGPVWVVEGRIVNEYALLLREEYEALLPEDRSRLRVHLGEVTFVDEQGADLLWQMEREKVELGEARAFVKEILEKRKQDDPASLR